MEIELIQGDTSPIYKFQRKNADNEVIKTKAKKMWITFKNTSHDEECIFQKTLENGIDYNENDNYYRFQLSSDETCNLNCRKYGFDIAIINEQDEKKTLLVNGILDIQKHYTKKCNEV